jgi:1,4-alpha-glucan branching enzyme
MQKKNKKTTAGTRRVTFCLSAGDAALVNLVGDFNQWDPSRHPMKPDKDGIWKKTLMLAPGRYEYKFQVDGKWHLDADNNLTCRNCYGSQNHFLVVAL